MAKNFHNHFDRRGVAVALLNLWSLGAASAQNLSFQAISLPMGSTDPQASMGAVVSIAVGDFKGTGVPDVTYTFYGFPPYLGGGFGFGRTIRDPSVAGEGRRVGFFPTFAVADFNGDGRSDLAISTAVQFGGIGRVYISLGDANKTLLPAPELSGDPNSSNNILAFETGRGPYSMVAGDFNGDGRADLAVFVSSPNAQNTVLVFLGNGDGTFKSAITSTVGPSLDYQIGLASSVVGDFNGDGIWDLGVSQDGAVVILLGKGGGTFQAKQKIGDGFLFQGGSLLAI
jgi:FG-GAP-like repeat/FG-GAP repeat